MKGILYFSHDCNAQHDPKIIKLIYRYGWAGYGIYWGIVEDLCKETPKHRLQKDYGCIAMAKRVNESLIKSIVEDFKLFKVDKKYFYSERMIDNMEFARSKSEKARQSALVRWSKNKDADVMPTQSERKAIKVNKTKLNKIKERNILFKKQVFEFTEQFDKSLLNDFFDYWSEPNKSNTKMRYEQEKTWDLNRRIKRWANNNFGKKGSNGVGGFKKDANGKFWIGYCDKCNVSDFYDDFEIKQDSKCCNSKLKPEKMKSA
tara:strand:- start:164 stop:943 length:780 start_codon:yes stop_codon:yes gene_type:complete